MENNTTTIQGKLIVIGEVERKSDKFSLRNAVVKTNDAHYAQSIPVQFTNLRASLLDNFSIGDSVIIKASVRGRDYQGKYFINLDGNHIALDTETMPETNKINGVQPNTEFHKETPQNTMVEDNSLPF